jgi:hypothetical protein
MIQTKFLDEIKEIAFKTYKESEPLRNKYVDYRILKPENFTTEATLKEELSEYIKSIIKEEKDTIGFALFVNNNLISIDYDNNLKEKGLIIEELIYAFNNIDFNFPAYFSKIVSPNEDKFTANHYLNLKTGLFIYVPKT